MIELLAPAGGMDQLKTAFRFGADAAYGGMNRYGLRAGAANFDDDALAQAIAYAHDLGKRFYVTMNLLPFDRDMDGFLEAARVACLAKADAAIVSDLGAALMLHKELPELPLHISTQANVLNTLTALHFHQVTGATRIVLSREMTLEDIRAMREKLPESVELEAFVHGAMCVSYSGRCLLSAAMVGRSANRGACSQPCRWGYHVVEEKRPGNYMPVYEQDHSTYLFSARDLCMLPHLPEMIEAGVCSLKIEGRMKTSYYVATVVSAYRQALNLLQEQGEDAYRAAIPSLMTELSKASHRVSNTGFYFCDPQPPAGAKGFEQSMEFVATVVSDACAGQPAKVEVKNRFYVGDALEVLTPNGSKSFSPTAISMADTGESVPTVSIAGTHVMMCFPFAVGAGDLLRGPNRNHRRED